MNLQENIVRIKSMMGLLTEQAEQPICDATGCSGTYTGPEFTNTEGDIAHQYSNVITKAVGLKLKELYQSGNYVKVNLNNITMSTTGMGTGNVVYKVKIPFMGVSNKCDAMTGFAHVGGWGHVPQLSARINEILSYIPKGKTKNTVVDNELYYNNKAHKTPEGLQEYWIQWKHSDYQSDCSIKTPSKNSNLPLVVSSHDLGILMDEIKIRTAGKTFDLNSAKVNIDMTNNYSVSIQESPNGTPVNKLVLAVGYSNKPCEACKAILTRNSNSKVIDEGTFATDSTESNRIYNLIAIF